MNSPYKDYTHGVPDEVLPLYKLLSKSFFSVTLRHSVECVYGNSRCDHVFRDVGSIIMLTYFHNAKEIFCHLTRQWVHIFLYYPNGNLYLTDADILPRYYCCSKSRSWYFCYLYQIRRPRSNCWGYRNPWIGRSVHLSLFNKINRFPNNC